MAFSQKSKVITFDLLVKKMFYEWHSVKHVATVSQAKKTKNKTRTATQFKCVK